MAMLEINHLQKKFGTTEVLRDVSLSVSKGDVVAILGPSGSGKTTLLRCVNFLERADAGELLFDDEKFDLNRASHRDLRVSAKRRRSCSRTTTCSATRRRCKT